MLPCAFIERMKRLLGDEYDSFAKAMEERAVRALRVNTLKYTGDATRTLARFSPEKIDYCNEGYIIRNADGIGNSPEHHGGAIYVQDPGAMGTLEALDVLPDWWVLDLCSAPGGKSGQAAAKIGHGGFIISNEYVPKRAKICVSNFERLGIRSAMVTSLDTAEFKKYFNACFDLVIADAPCSGEGMFRKGEIAIEEWSEENVLISAKRQKEILDNAAPLVAPGGYLLYSTCTYSLEENEMQIDAFLSEHSDYRLVSVKDALIEKTRDGISFDGARCKELHKTRRFYPHISDGEGQFIALMQRDESIDEKKAILYKNPTSAPSREEMRIAESFLAENLKKRPDGKIAKIGDKLVFISHGPDPLPKSVFLYGVLIGEIRKGILHPEHQFFSAYGNEFKKQENLSFDDPRLSAYLAGEEIDATISDGGFCAVLYEGISLGGGKISGGKIKNYYPKGLRLTAKNKIQ